MKKLITVHGWGGAPESEAWNPWLRKELESKDFEIIAPAMPNTDEPEINAWINKLKEEVGTPDENTYLIGHSIGCQAILRYLETLEPSVKIAKTILVAPWTHLDEKTIEEEGEEVREIAKPWMETPINWEKAKTICNKFLCIFSNNDPYVPLSDSEIFKEKLNAEIIIKHNEEHFNDTQEIKEIVEFIAT